MNDFNCICCGHPLNLNVSKCPNCGTQQLNIYDINFQDSQTDIHSDTRTTFALNTNVRYKNREYLLSILVKGDRYINISEDELEEIDNAFIQPHSIFRHRNVKANIDFRLEGISNKDQILFTLTPIDNQDDKNKET